MAAGFIQAIVSACLFGLMPFFARQIYALGGNSMALCLYRFGFSIPFLYLMIRFGLRQRPAVTRKQLCQLAFLSVWTAVTPVLLFESYHYIPSGMASTLNFVYPIMVVVGCVVFYRARLTREKVICCALCAVGILCFYTPEGGGSNMKGILLAFLSGVTYAVYIVYYGKGGLSELPALTSTFYISCFSTALLAIVTIASGNFVFYSSGRAWGLTIWFAFMVSVMATALFQGGVKRIGPENASLLSTFEPLTTVVVGFLCREPLTARALVGIACILIAVLFLTLVERREAGRVCVEGAERKI